MLAERREMRYKTLVLWDSSDLEAGFSYGSMEKVRRARQSRFSPSPGTCTGLLSVVLWGAASGDEARPFGIATTHWLAKLEASPAGLLVFPRVSPSRLRKGLQVSASLVPGAL
jgi:hypothetical protein